jgi:glycosyltransferase involved in cell wall biosynthesis
MMVRKLLFLGEVNRADAQTWMNGLREFGGFDIVTWEIKKSGNGWKRVLRWLEYIFLSVYQVRQAVKLHKPDMVIAERTTSYGFLAACSGCQSIAIAQQGITDLFPPDSPWLPLKRALRKRALHAADIVHAWGEAMVPSLQEMQVDMHKVLVLAKGIDLRKFQFVSPELKSRNPLKVIVTRSLTEAYRHEVILEAAAHLHRRGILVEWIIVGDGHLRARLVQRAGELGLEEVVHFKGRVPNDELPSLISECLVYVSMPVSEGVSASLFEAMAVGSFPIVSDLPGTRCWINHNDNGMLVPVNDASALAEGVACFAAAPERFFDAIHRNRKLVEEKADYARNMKQIAAEYHALIDRRNIEKSTG